MSTQPIKLIVRGGGYPVHIEIVVDGGSIELDHRRLLELEHAVAQAKRITLVQLPRNLWHEINPTLAGQ